MAVVRGVSKSLFPLGPEPLAIDIPPTLIRSVIASFQGFHQPTDQYFPRAGPETRIACYLQDSRFALWTLGVFAIDN
jgi:hypothetical protein